MVILQKNITATEKKYCSVSSGVEWKEEKIDKVCQCKEERRPGGASLRRKTSVNIVTSK